MVGIFSALAKELECDFASLFGTIPAPSLTKDGVNPDGAGNAAIAQILSQKIAAIAP